MHKGNQGNKGKDMAKSRTRRTSLRRTILGFTLTLVFLAVFLVGGSGGLYAAWTIQQGIQQQVAGAADLKENEITRWVNEREGDLAVLATEDALRENWLTLLNTPEEEAAYVKAYSDLAVRLNELLRKKVAFVDISLLHAETGQILVSTEVLREREYHEKTSFFLQGRESVYVESVELDPVLNAPTLLIARPVEGPDGETIAVLAGRANLAELGAVLEADIGLGGESQTHLLSKDAGYLSGSLEFDAQPRGMSRGVGFQRAVEGEEGRDFYVDYAGENVIGAYRWISPLQAVLLIEAPRSVVTQDVALVFGVSMGVALLAGGIAAVSALILTRRIVNPIEELTAAVTEIATGDLDRRVTVKRSDEIGVLARGFNTMADRLRELLNTLEERIAARTRDAERRARDIQKASELSATIAAIRDLDELLTEVTRRISEQFGFYHVGVFLPDETGDYAVLQAANSPGGRRMLRRGHKLPLGEGIVGYAAAEKEPRIALDVGQDAVFFDNPALPETRSEMALPLVVGDDLVGVLDIQSQEGGAFSHEDITILEGLAGQLAVSIENARLFTRSEEAIASMRRAYGEITRASWERLLQAEETFRYLSTPEGVFPVQDRVQGALPQDMQVEGAELVAPLKVRDQVIGGFRVAKHNKGEAWTEEEINLLETLTEQLGVALESARLYEDTQRRAAREQLTGEVTARIRETLDVNKVLQTATREMRRVLDLAEVEIRMGLDASERE